jgi:hypothetical protein
MRTPARSGLNWGQRPGRNENQAYLPVPAEIQRSNFFPDRGVIFNITCDDGFEMTCKRAQANGKAIQSTDNSILGGYFRRRLGLLPGELIVLYHLEMHGRFWVEVYKKTEHGFYLDFSKLS